MKRKVSCFFSFLLILLVFFTIVSPKVEEEMYTLVDARKGEGKGNRNVSVGTIAIIWENSNDRLFNIVEGDGWESGLRIAEIPSAYFDRYEGHVELGAGTEYWYVYSASREPVLGSAVKIVETERGEDTYLLWHPIKIDSLDKLPNSMDVISKSDNAAIVSNWGATFPFFEHNIWYSLQDDIGKDLRVYSFHDIQQLIEAVPWIAGLVTVLFCSLFLLWKSWEILGRSGRKRIVLTVNVVLMMTLLASLPLLLLQFDLPASLMPKKYILDISHYRETFSRILSSMKNMGYNYVQMELIRSGLYSISIFGTGVLLTGIICAGEYEFCRYHGKYERSRFRKR